MLRNLATSEQRRLLDCYNNIWWSGQVPEAWRTAIVAPILKSNKPANELSSYRPVSLTSAACKVMEAIALARLEWVARACGFLADQQTGFRRRRCTADSIADVVSTLEDARASGDLAMLLLIDVKGAFDGLPHAVVQQALDLLGIGGNLRRFLSSFLNDRTLRVSSELRPRTVPAFVQVKANRFLLDNFASTAAAMGDITDDQIFDISQVTLDTENMKVEPPATAGRRRRKNCGRRSSAKPRRKCLFNVASARQPAVQAPSEDVLAKRVPPQKPTSRLLLLLLLRRECGYGGYVKSETAVEVPLETVTVESESTIDQQADMYVSKILPDPATTVYAERGSVPAASCSDHAYDSCEKPPTPPPHRRRGGRVPRPTPVRRRRRRVAVDGEERVVCKPQSGRWSSRLPVGTVVRRPSVKLVQLVAQAIHESPHRVLRVSHVYAALQNRYPYYRIQDKNAISSWKSSVRHALFQKWFMKFRPTSGLYETFRPRSFFWGLNYSSRPHEWQMPQRLPHLFLPTDDEGEQRDGDASTLCSGLHLNTESPSKTNTALMPSAFRLQLEHDLFAPPEPQSPGDKRKLSTVPCSESAPVTSAAQSEDDLASVGSPPSESMNPVGWPAPGKREKHALQPPSDTACAAPPRVWDGMHFKPVRAFGGVSRWATPPPMQQYCVLKTCMIVDDDRGLDDLFDDVRADLEDMYWAYVNNVPGSVGFGHDEPLAPCSPLCSPPYVNMTSPSQTPLPTAASTRVQTPSQKLPAIPGPSQTPEEALLRPMPQEQPDRLEHFLSGYGRQWADDECFAFVNASWTLWNYLIRLGVVKRSAESHASGEGGRIAALVVAPPSTPLPTHVDNCGLILPEEADRPFTGSEE
ncbi:hypothetical protein HPB49_016198 [Dermacentor silvarum]|uniref:Uncharacterized protein n=1 Tax=Dermacentor silvarum TaxID=543639 RepID=A0ACB8DJK8_DERSI|nr:hypothetical protein HPB49_016198 [Dermacentor silvarum]